MNSSKTSEDLGGELNLYSFNVRGIRDCRKRNCVFNYLKDNDNCDKDNCGLILLQETYSLPGDKGQWEKDWGNDIILNHGTAHSKRDKFRIRKISCG